MLHWGCVPSILEVNIIECGGTHTTVAPHLFWRFRNVLVFCAKREKATEGLDCSFLLLTRVPSSFKLLLPFFQVLLVEARWNTAFVLHSRSLIFTVLLLFFPFDRFCFIYALQTRLWKWSCWLERTKRSCPVDSVAHDFILCCLGRVPSFFYAFLIKSVVFIAYWFVRRLRHKSGHGIIRNTRRRLVYFFVLSNLKHSLLLVKLGTNALMPVRWHAIGRAFEEGASCRRRLCHHVEKTASVIFDRTLESGANFHIASRPKLVVSSLGSVDSRVTAFWVFVVSGLRWEILLYLGYACIVRAGLELGLPLSYGVSERWITAHFMNS